MLKVENFRKTFGDLVAVDNLSFEVRPGQILGLLGANGAGKSTTFRSIMDIAPATSGEITYFGKKIDLNVSHEIGYMCEQRALVTKYTVEKQLKFYGSLKGMNNKELDIEIDKWLKLMRMEEVKKKTIKELSKGNQQKIQFISTLIHKPKLIILDEPFSGLDPFNVKIFKDIILQLRDQGSIIIFSSHRLDHVEYFCENIIVLVEGKDLLRGNISDLKKQSSISKVIVASECPVSQIESLNFVTNVNKSAEHMEVYLENSTYSSQLFDVIKQYPCTNYSMVLPTLEEVFLEKVGESYEA